MNVKLVASADLKTDNLGLAPIRVWQVLSLVGCGLGGKENLWPDFFHPQNSIYDFEGMALFE